MDFTPEERAYIDAQLRLSDEMQIRNGNKLTPFDEFMDELIRKDLEEVG